MLLPSFTLPLLIVASVWGIAEIERVLVALALGSLAGLPNSEGAIFITSDPSAGYSGFNLFTVSALILGLVTMLRKRTALLELALMSSIPLLCAGVSYYAFGADRLFVFSEFLKYVAFLCFVFYAVNVRYQRRLVEDLVPCLYVCMLAVGTLLYLGFGLGYYYGGRTYMFASASIVVVPIMVIMGVERRYGLLVLLISGLLAVGVMQASVKLILLVLCAFAAILIRRVGSLGLAATAALSVPIFVWAFEFMPDGVRHKTMTFLWLASGKFGDMGNVFFFTSAGNLLAEAMTVFNLLAQRMLLPIGPGFGLLDYSGLLGYANQFAYPEVAFRTGVFYPLHLGFFYLCLWYGLALPVARPILSSVVFLVVFALTGMTYKPLLFLAAVASPVAVRQLRRNRRHGNP